MPGGVHPPPSVIASWPKPNFVNPVTQDWTVAAILLMFLSVTFLIVCARFWARLVIAKNAGLDDILIAIAMPPLIGLTITFCLGTRSLGFQVHTWDHSPELAVISRKVVMAIELLYIFATCPTKISILFFYRRMAVGTISKNFIRCVWASIVFVALYGTVFTFTLVFTCSPASAFWNSFDHREKFDFKCRDESAELLAAASISIIQDVIACVLPVMLLWNLRLPRRQKLAVYTIFGLGLLTTVCGALRIYYVVYVYHMTYDISWACVPGFTWTCIEADLAVICASAPALKVFFGRYLNIPSQNSGHSMGYMHTPFGAGTADRLETTTSHSRTLSSSAASPLSQDAIKVSHSMNVTIESREQSTSDFGEASARSSKELTAVPNTDKSLPTTLHERAWPSSTSRTVCFAAHGPSELGLDVERRAGKGWR